MNNVNVWQGALFGATQPLTCTVPAGFARFAVTVANPDVLVVALPAESEAVPFVTKKLTAMFAMGLPRFRASTVSGTAIVAPSPIQRVGVMATKSMLVDVASTLACCICGGE